MTISYESLIAELSATLPMHGLETRDVKLTGAELAIVVAKHGGSRFVCDALEIGREDAFDKIAVRCTNDDVFTATMQCGLAVMSHVQEYAAERVIEDVNALRADERPGLTPEAIARLHGVWASGDPLTGR